MPLKPGAVELLAGLVCAWLATIHPAIAQSDSEDLVNFSFARYLGTGYYSTDDSRVFVFQVPLTSEIRPMTDEERGIVLRYPVTIGLTDFNIDGEGEDQREQVPDVPDIDDVATISLVPGIELRYPLRENWHVAPFFDLGIAHDFDSNESSRLLGLGLKSFANFEYHQDVLTLGNRLLYAKQTNIDGDGSSSFSVLQTGVDYRFGAAEDSSGRQLDVSLYYIHSYYMDDLGLPQALETTIRLTNTNEFGFTFGLPALDWLPEDPRLGFGVQFADDLEVYRIVFGMPFF